jgi:hypothetical protein
MNESMGYIPPPLLTSSSRSQTAFGSWRNPSSDASTKRRPDRCKCFVVVVLLFIYLNVVCVGWLDIYVDECVCVCQQVGWCVHVPRPPSSLSSLCLVICILCWLCCTYFVEDGKVVVAIQRGQLALHHLCVYV